MLARTCTLGQSQETRIDDHTALASIDTDRIDILC